MTDRKIRRALVAVYDKTGVAEFARTLVDEFGIEIISTGGTAKHLKEAGIPVTLVEQVTGFPEMLDGRVKTLHPKIHAAILADRDNPDHMRQLAEQGIEPIDMVVVNLYPFEKTVADPNCTFEQAIEMIDIGGPCLLRAAAKNHRHVLVACDPSRYTLAEMTLRSWNDPVERQEALKSLAFLAFQATSTYDARVATWLSIGSNHRPLHLLLTLFNWGPLRYGENPHQAAELLMLSGSCDAMDLTTADCCADQEDSQGEFSHNNFLDADAALGLCAELTRAQGKVWHRLIAGAGSRELNGAAEQAHRLLAGATPSRTTPPSATPSGATPSGSTDITSTPSGADTGRPPKSNAVTPPINDEKFTRRNLPHLQRPGATYFVTFRVRNGVLDPMERDIVMECCFHLDGKKACIHAVVVMPDHAHVLLTPLEASPGDTFHIGDILHGIKGVSGRRIADRRGRDSGAVWLDESWDRIMRGKKEFLETLEYIRFNAVTAGIVKDEAYPWCVYEQEPEWSPADDAAGVDSQHSLVCDAGVAESRDWHRLLAGATPSTSPSTPAPAEQAKTPSCGDGRDCVACFIKHTNACGAAMEADPVAAYRKAYLGDPNAAMGGILAVNFEVTASFAETVMETYQRWGKAAGAGGFFVEVWIAPSFQEQAVDVIRTKKEWGKRVRLLAVGDMGRTPNADAMVYRSIAGGMLVQTPDVVGLNEDQWKVVTKRAPTETEMADLRLAWLVCKHTKSNAITVCKNGMLIGNGAGQMSRVMSCRIATWLAKENGHAEQLPGAVAASDAFFPFRDGPDILMDAGVTAFIQPGGSKRDADTIAACDDRGAAMIFTGTRHFKH